MNPRIKKILRNIMFLLSIPLIIFAFVFANIRSQKDICNGLDISIVNPAISFVNKDDIINVIEEQQIKPLKTLVKDIKIRDLENKVKENKWVKETNIYISTNNIMHIQVEQKTPIVRVNQKDSNDYAYYLDEYANALAWSSVYSPKLPVVTAPKLGYSRKDLNTKSDLVMLAKYLTNDTFWNAAISQIDVLPSGQIQLIPVIGKQIIILGDVKDLEDKMARLLLFYQEGMFTVDWEKYDEIDLRYIGQVVCRNSRGEKISEDPYGIEEQKEIKKLDSKKEKLVKGSSKPAHDSKTISHKPLPKVVAKEINHKVTKSNSENKKTLTHEKKKNNSN